MSNGIEFHNRGEATKKECLKALMVEDNKFNIKECDLVGKVLKSKNQWQWFYVKYSRESKWKNKYGVL